MDSIKVTLWNSQQAHKVFRDAWMLAKSALMAGHRLTFELRSETRSLPQNAKLHALLTDISLELEWAGKKRDVETWKRLMTAAWTRARGEHTEILPAIDGHGFDIVFRRTSKLTRTECAELLEYVTAWAAEHGVETYERS